MESGQSCRELCMGQIPGDVSYKSPLHETISGKWTVSSQILRERFPAAVVLAAERSCLLSRVNISSCRWDNEMSSRVTCLPINLSEQNSFSHIRDID